MKRVLYITQKPHAPVVDGGTQAIASCFHLLSQSKDIELTYAPICTKKHPGDFSKTDDSIRIFPLQINPKITIKVVLKSLSSPMNVLRYTVSNAESQLQTEDDARNFDVVICDGFYALSIIPRRWFTSKKIIYRSHNIEHKHWEQRARFEPWYVRWFYKHLCNRLITLEKMLVVASHAVLSISDQETALLSTWNQNTITWYPSITMNPSVQEPRKYENHIGFVGNFKWFPNTDAIHWFIQSIWPLILKEQSSAILEIAGKGSDVFDNPEQNIRGLGFIPSLDEFYKRQSIIISPLSFGTGLNMKIIEALSFGKAIVATPTSVQGFKNKAPFIVSDSSIDFAAQVIQLLSDERTRLNKEAESIAFAVREFDDALLLNQLEERIHG
ncbi:MAG: glycosyltransferase [Flavobacteriales bacterium]